MASYFCMLFVFNISLLLLLFIIKQFLFFILFQIVNIVPSDTLRWVLVIIGFAISGFFITRNLYPIISRADSKTSRLLLIFVLAAHAAFALLLKFEFFSYTWKA